MNDLKNKKSGLLFGSYCADALSLGVHWIYDSQELVKKHGRVTEYKAPGSILTTPTSKRGIRGMWETSPFACYNFLQEKKSGILPCLWRTGLVCGPTTTTI